MTMELPADVAQFVNDQVAIGKYASAEDVLRDAVKSLQRYRTEVDAIQEGIDDMHTSRFRSIEDADAEISRRHKLSSAMD